MWHYSAVKENKIMQLGRTQTKLEVIKLGKTNPTQKDKLEEGLLTCRVPKEKIHESGSRSIRVEDGPRELGRVMSQVNVIKVASHHGRKHHGETHCQGQLINANEAYGGMGRQSQCWIQGLLIDLTYIYALTQD